MNYAGERDRSEDLRGQDIFQINYGQSLLFCLGHEELIAKQKGYDRTREGDGAKIFRPPEIMQVEKEYLP